MNLKEIKYLFFPDEANKIKLKTILVKNEYKIIKYIVFNSF